MPRREDNIRDEITRLEGQIFERFATELLSRKLYPGLNPTSRTHDLGEDAKTEPSTIFLHNGTWISLAISKEGTYSKVSKDCNRCQSTGRKIDLLVFVTAKRPRSGTVDNWKTKVKTSYGWELEVRTIDFLAPFASRPEYEDLVDDYLHIPPPGNDFIQNIEREFKQETSRILRQIRVTIPGISESLPRTEVDWVEDQLKQSRPVVLTGEPGSGKSGIAYFLASRANESGKSVLLIDAGNFAGIQCEADLRHRFSLNGALSIAAERLGKNNGCRVIIDQLDSIAGLPSVDILIGLAGDLIGKTGVELVYLLRTREGHENHLTSKLVKLGFVELKCHLLSDDEVTRILELLGIADATDELVDIGKNLLNLEIIALIKINQIDFDFSRLKLEIDLWDYYCQSIREREKTANSNHIMAEAVRLATMGLNRDDRSFVLEEPISQIQNRLISWGLIIQDEGRIYRFRHEELQDYLYANYATEQGYMPKNVLQEIRHYRVRNVFVWMNNIYRRKRSRFLGQFLEDMFDVQ